MRKFAFLLLLLMIIQAGGATVREEGGRTLSGIIYFTNNTPRDRETFPIELFTSDEKTHLAGTTPDDHGSFEFKGLQPGKYLLKLTWPNFCTLSYRVDLRAASKTGIRIVMDAACAHHNGKTTELPEN